VRSFFAALLFAALAGALHASTLPAVTPQAILLQWDESSPQDPAVGYNAWRSTDGAAYAQINTEEIDATEFTDTTAPLDCNCWYYVTALDCDGNQSMPSNIAVVLVGAELGAGTLIGATT
jgi:fibronectin type 3 domain-containing protein